MTSPENVGAVEVDLIADSKLLAKSIREGVESAFKGLDFDKLIRDSLGNKPIKIPVTPDVDTDGLGEKVKQTRVPKVPVEVDPLFTAFQQDLRRQAAALAKEVHLGIPVDADTEGLRAELGAQLAELAKQSKLAIPAEPADKAAFQAKLQEQLDEVKARVKASVVVEPDTHQIPEKIKETPVPKVKVEVDPVLSAFQAGIRAQIAALSRTVNAKIPIGAETAGLRADLSAQLAALRNSVKVDVPTEPGSRAEYEAKLKAQLEEVSHRVKQSVPVDVDTKGSPDLSSLSGLAGKITPNILGGGALSAIGSLFQTLGDQVGKFAEEAAAGGSELATSIGGAAGPIGAVIGLVISAQTAVLALGAAATVLVPAFTAAAGAAAAIPAGLVGLGAAAGTLFLGFKGISDAFKPKAGGGGGGAGQSAAQQARQVASAARQVEAARRGITAANRSYEASERSLAAAQRGVVTAQRNEADAEQALADAQKKSTQSQLAVNQARVDAANDLVDLNLQLKGSQLSEQEATLAVTDALRALNAAQLTGNIPDIQAADLAYQRAQLTLQQNTQQTKELGQQTVDANAKGVEGSDKVQSALQDQQDALEGVQKAQEGVADAQNGILDAADSLKSAQDGVLSAADGIKSATDSLKSAQDSLAQSQEKTAAGAAAAAAQVTKLAPAAQSFVNALKALKPAFEDLRLDVQQRLFDGLDKTVTHLGDAWIPALKTTLGNYADTFNAFFKNLGASLSTPKFISDIQDGAEGARKGLSKIGDAVAIKLVPAFGDLAKAAGPFLANLGGKIADGITKFSDFITKVSTPDKGGTSQLSTFFDKASKALDSIARTGGLVVKIIGDVLSIITGAQQTSGKTPIDSFNDALSKIDTWLKDPKHQKQIHDLIIDLQNAFISFGKLAGKVNDALGAVGTGGNGVAGTVGRAIGAALIAGLLIGVENAMKANLNAFFTYFLPVGPLVQGIKAVLGINSPSTVFAEIGGNLVEGLIVGIGDGFVGLLAKTAEIPGLLIRALQDAPGWLVSTGGNAVVGLINGLIDELPTLSSYAGTVRTTVTNKLSDAASWLKAHGGNTVLGYISGFNSKVASVGTAARSIATSVVNSVSNLYNTMIVYGKNVVIGLYNGIVSMGSFLYNGLINWVRQNVPAPIRAVLGINSPSKVAHELGQFVGQGLAEGITSQAGVVSAAADEIAKLAVPQVDDVTAAFGSGLDGVLTSSLQASSQQQLLIGFKPGMTGDPILDALRQVIDVQYQGSIDRALVKAR